MPKSNTRLRRTLWLLCPVCLWCERPLRLDEMTVDHVIPKSHGGTYRMNNCAPSCWNCNHKRMNNLPTEQQWAKFVAWLQSLSPLNRPQLPQVHRKIERSWHGMSQRRSKMKSFKGPRRGRGCVKANGTLLMLQQGRRP